MIDYYTEIEYDDEVYEDSYYEINYNEEELTDEENFLDEEEKVNSTTNTFSFACEDCDYRWDEKIICSEDDIEDDMENFTPNCPMCGSTSVIPI